MTIQPLMNVASTIRYHVLGSSYDTFLAKYRNTKDTNITLFREITDITKIDLRDQILFELARIVDE